MALIARLREARGDVIGISRPLVVLEVAAHASRTGEVVVVVDVAVCALPRRHGVPATQRKSNRRVVEGRVEPRVSTVAGRAIRGERGGHMAWVRSGFEIRSVAGVALCRHRLKLAAGGTFVARVAIHRRVCTGERETAVVLLDLLDGYLPAPNGVALFAIRPELTAVNVGVTVLAALSNVHEHRLHMALNARHRLMHTTQRVFRLIVVEFRNRPNRFPCFRRVAILAGNGQISVRTMRPVGHLCSPRHSEKGQDQQHKEFGYAP